MMRLIWIASRVAVRIIDLGLLLVLGIVIVAIFIGD